MAAVGEASAEWIVDIWYTDREGLLDIRALEKLVTNKTKIVAVTAASNVLGTINPIKEIVRTVKRLNPKCLVVVDAAQAVPHMPVNVRRLGSGFCGIFQPQNAGADRHWRTLG